MKKDKVFIEGYVVGSFADTLGTQGKQIHIASGDIVDIDDNFIYKSIEPEKVKVPQIVVNWYEENKDDFETSLFQCIYELFKKRNDSELSEFENWVIDENTKPFQTLVNMHQFGYEVEKEKRYFVKIRATKHYFSRDGKGKIFFSLAYKGSFTKKRTRRSQLRLGIRLSRY